ncbi:hypothetical protein [Streptomyces sp. NPDC000410]|uniref:hypothetical protein n=1 Tax=Streptomyces sp. NPDC000410 TaxID=3154254 RepID=UPI00331EC752
MSNWKNTTVAYLQARFNVKSDKGQTAVEYIGMLIAVIAIIAVVAGMTDIGTTIGDKIREAVEGIGG